jgi:hypothetical protein
VAEPDLAYIAADIRHLAVPVDSPDLHRWPGNPRRGNLHVIMDSLVEFGQQSPIVVQTSTGHIAAGNHVYDATIALGRSHVAVARVPLDDAEARAYLLADNRLSDLAVYDPDALRSLLAELDAADALAGTGFTRDELNAMTLDAPSGSGGGSGGGGDGSPRDTEAWDGPALRMLVLRYPPERAEALLRWCGRLRGAYGTTSTVSTILRAVERQSQP